MSAPIATPQHQAQRAPRRSERKARPSEQSNLDSVIPAVPSAGGPQRTSSPATGNATKNNNKGQSRKASNANNKTHPELKNGNNHYEKAKPTPTPMKPAAYAGSTFQQSPAASALPLPSFYSKSVPTASSIPSRPTTSESTDPEISSATPIEESPAKRETTPCDFLFEAARQAKATPRADSPATRPGNLSVPNGSPASRSPAPREGDAMFPFELDGANAGEDGSPFATPYKDRIDAVRSTKSTSRGGKSMDERERKAKTEALKKLLMKSGGQENSGNNNESAIDASNPFNARAPFPRTAAMPQGSPQTRSNSNPSTPMYAHEPTYRSPQNFTPVGYPFPTPQTNTPKRPNSSRLRHVYGAQSEQEYAELSSDSAITPPHSTHKSTPQQPPQYNGIHYTSQPQMPGHRAKPSAQQLEDDLRRVLKLDLTSRG